MDHDWPAILTSDLRELAESKLKTWEELLQRFPTLAHATMAAHLEAVQLHVARGAPPNNRNTRGETALHSSSRAGSIDIFMFLLSSGGDVDVRTATGRTVLHQAAEGGAVSVLALILAETPLPIDTTDLYGNSALHVAAKFGHSDAVTFLLSKGADPDKANNHGNPPAFLGLKKGFVEAARLCLKEMRQPICANEDNYTTGHFAARAGDHQTLGMFLKEVPRGVSVQSRRGWTLLHMAALGDQPATIEYLITRKADVGAQDNFGQTALHVAAYYACGKAARKLVEMGALVSTRSFMGRGETAADIGTDLDLVFWLRSKLAGSAAAFRASQ